MAEPIKKQADLKLKDAYRDYYASIYRYCLAKLKDNYAAEDAVQETYIVLYKKFVGGIVVENVRAFLYRTADNFVHKKLEEAKKRNRIVDIDDAKESIIHYDDVDSRLSFEEYSRQISAALSDKEADLFSLRYIEDLPIDEVAKRMGLSIGATTTRLSRLRDKIRNALGDINL